jgi:2'-5' RNA ligase
MKILSLLILLVSFKAMALQSIVLSNTITDSSGMLFFKHSNSLALNVEYFQVKKIRTVIENDIKQKLKFFTAWDSQGEAHITVITPPEFSVLSKHVSIEKINEISLDNNIQSSDLKILGLGTGRKDFSGKIEKTFFLIADSQNLRNIRHKIYDKYKANGGDPSLFDPTWFFPHITIGYTKTDLHENSGVIKNIRHSYNKSYKIILE